VTGFASRSLQRQGAYINAMGADSKLTYVAKVEPMWVNFSVSQNQLSQRNDMVKAGQLVIPQNGGYDVEVVLPDGRSYAHRGKLNFADPSFSQETGTFLVRGVLPNPNRELRPGMFVTVKLHGGNRPNAIVVPQLAVQQGSNGHLLYVVKQDGSAEVRPVVAGDYYGEKEIIIVSGLHAGDRVVVDGALKVVPGQPVKIVEPGAAAPGKAGAGATTPAKDVAVTDKK